MCVLGAVALLTSSQDEAQTAFCATFVDCNTCVGASNDSYSGGISCYWCKTTSNGTVDQCLPVTATLPIEIEGECPHLNFNVGTCSLTALIIVILISVAALIFIICCCACCCVCCCWCARRRKRARLLEEAHYNQEKESIRQHSNERRAERKAKNEEIRRKYGLDDTAGTYKRLE